MHVAVSFCCFLGNEEIRDQVEKNLEYFSTTLLHTYRASNLMFQGECEVEEAKSFSRKLLEKIMADRNNPVQSLVSLSFFFFFPFSANEFVQF